MLRPASKCFYCTFKKTLKIFVVNNLGELVAYFQLDTYCIICSYEFTCAKEVVTEHQLSFK